MRWVACGTALRLVKLTGSFVRGLMPRVTLVSPRTPLGTEWVRARMKRPIRIRQRRERCARGWSWRLSRVCTGRVAADYGSEIIFLSPPTVAKSYVRIRMIFACTWPKGRERNSHECPFIKKDVAKEI